MREKDMRYVLGSARKKSRWVTEERVVFVREKPEILIEKHFAPFLLEFPRLEKVKVTLP
jgi:hypothetical protein